MVLLPSKFFLQISPFPGDLVLLTDRFVEEAHIFLNTTPQTLTSKALLADFRGNFGVVSCSCFFSEMAEKQRKDEKYSSIQLNDSSCYVSYHPKPHSFYRGTFCNAYWVSFQSSNGRAALSMESPSFSLTAVSVVLPKALPLYTE